MEAVATCASEIGVYCSATARPQPSMPGPGGMPLESCNAMLGESQMCTWTHTLDNSIDQD